MTFSILIPCYNIAPYLEKCLQSVIQQTYKDWEAILVDDGSTDGTDNIIKSYVVKDNRIKSFFQDENQGVAVVRNILLKEATGDYIIFLDSDDWWKSKYGLEKIAAASRGKSMDIIVFQHEIFKKDGSRELRTNNINFLDESKIYTGKDYLKNVLGKKITYQWFPWLCAFKRQLWVENHIKFNPNTYAYEDEEILYKVILHASKMVVIHEPIYQYRIVREGQLTQSTKKMVSSMIDVSVKNIKKVMETDMEQELKVLLCDNFSGHYYGALYSVNYLRKSEAREVFSLLDKYRFIMAYTRKKKHVILSKFIRFFGLHATSKLWFLVSNVKRKWKHF